MSVATFSCALSFEQYLACGVRAVSAGGGWWNYIIAGVFGLAFLHCSLMFVRGIQATNAAEAVPRKYGLLLR